MLTGTALKASCKAPAAMLRPCALPSSLRPFQQRSAASHATASSSSSAGRVARRVSVSVRASGAVATKPAQRPALKREEVITGDPANNVTDYIFEKIGTNLHHKADHPIGIIKQAIHDYFDETAPGKTMQGRASPWPVVHQANWAAAQLQPAGYTLLGDRCNTPNADPCCT